MKNERRLKLWRSSQDIGVDAAATDRGEEPERRGGEGEGGVRGKVWSMYREDGTQGFALRPCLSCYGNWSRPDQKGFRVSTEKDGRKAKRK